MEWTLLHIAYLKKFLFDNVFSVLIVNQSINQSINLFSQLCNNKKMTKQCKAQ